VGAENKNKKKKKKCIDPAIDCYIIVTNSGALCWMQVKLQRRAITTAAPDSCLRQRYRQIDRHQHHFKLPSQYYNTSLHLTAREAGTAAELATCYLPPGVRCVVISQLIQCLAI